MTATRSEGKAKRTTKATRDTSRDDELKVAYEIHALAQMLYGHISTAHPWTSPVPPPVGFTPSMPWMTTPAWWPES